MSLEEAILEKVRQLPPAKQEKVLRFADDLQNRPEVRTVPYNDRRKEMEWIAANRDAYVGLWVAVEGDQLIAADPDAMKVYTAAKQAGIKTPFLEHIHPIEEFYVGGWEPER